jgi:type IV secretory pathway protease TraF
VAPELLGTFFRYDEGARAYRVCRRGTDKDKGDTLIGTVENRGAVRAYLYEHGFFIDDVHYVRYKRSAGSSREGQCLFIAEPLYEDMMAWSACGLDPEAVTDRASWEAYISLTLSSIEKKIHIPKQSILLIRDRVSTFTDDVVSVTACGKGLSAERGRAELFNTYTVITRPVDKRENYIKRCVALPGDTFRITDGELIINDKPQDPIAEKQYCYTIHTSSPISPYTIEQLGITELSGSGTHYFSPLTDQMVETLLAMDNVISIERYTVEDECFPYSSRYAWTADNMGPLWVPAAGATIELNEDTWPLYERIIDVYEDNDVEVRNGEYYINGEKATSYTFKMNYYWMMGDNRHNSADSRYWGFVPEDHVVGKASFIWFSSDQAKSFPYNIRWNRLFTKVR